MFYDKMDQRARLLPGEYRRKVAEVDRVHHGTTDGQVGPLQARLEQLAGGEGLQDLLGLCVGARTRLGLGYCSTDSTDSRALYLSRRLATSLDSTGGYFR